MSVFDEIKPRIEQFKTMREQVMSSVRVPVSDARVNWGQPPFAIEDGTNYFAVLHADGTVSPLPFGYQLPEEYINDDGTEAIFSMPVAGIAEGIDVIRYVPLVDDYKLPSERAFCWESAGDSEVFQTISVIADTICEMVAKKSKSNFNRQLTNVAAGLYESYGQFESIDQAVAALTLESHVMLEMILRSFQHAIDAIAGEISNEAEI